MPKLRVRNFSISLDGYGAGPNQSADEGLGVGGERLHEWVFKTRSGRRYILGKDDGEEGLDEDVWNRGTEGIGAYIMGRNMFGPIRGEWGDTEWKGWWGDDPPYHTDVFVLTHYEHAPIPMQGGTTFHFVTDGIEAALERAFDSAGGKDVQLGGGVSVIQQYMRAGLLDELHVAVAPIFLGAGERLFDDVGDDLERYKCVELVSSKAVTHVTLART